MDQKRLIFPLIAVQSVLSGLFAPVLAAAEDPSWPCEQALVKEVPAAVVWDGPSVETLQGQWKTDAEITSLVRRLTTRNVDRAQDETLIDAFASAQPTAEERDRKLTILFTGILQVLNADRSKLNDGILRYSRDQQRRAEVLDAHLTEMVRLESAETEEAQKRVTQLNAQIDLEQRVFDDREKSIRFLCSRPQLVEQRIGKLARTISAQLH